MKTIFQHGIGQRLFLTSLILLHTVTPSVVCDMFTSAAKIVELANSEDIILDALKKHDSTEYNRVRTLSQVLSQQLKTDYLALHHEDRWQRALHPNEAFFIIKYFTGLIAKHPGLMTHLKDSNFSVPSETDYYGSLSSLIRLQRVYRLSVQQMYTGNYSGYLGPSLAPEDTFMLGRQAVMDGYLEYSTPWLQLAVDVLQSDKLVPDSETWPKAPITVSFSQAAALLGRVYFYAKDMSKAREMYLMSSKLDPNGGDVQRLRQELNFERRTDFESKDDPWAETMSELCSRDKQQRVSKIRPFHMCRYKAAGGLAYLRYKEEILSVNPYASVFYEVVHDGEVDSIKKFINTRLSRGKIGTSELDLQTSKDRTGDVAWIQDENLQLASKLSERIEIITGLELDQRFPDGPSSAEGFQVVNYGLGGHYFPHLDSFIRDEVVLDDDLYKKSGERLATFLIYLSDVEKGGSTVFVKTGISVAPIKGMVLFWYNHRPDMTVDPRTEHAGCPVLFGQKWIANKWIWTYGNTFRRPCGPHPNSTQLDIERLLLRQTVNTTRN